MNNTLAIDTSTHTLTLALSTDDGVLLRHQSAPRQHGALLLPWLSELMSEAGIGFADLSAIFCGVGPGGFTGIRTGVCAAQAIAVAHDIPVVGVSSLQIIAQAAFDGLYGEKQGADGMPVCSDKPTRQGLQCDISGVLVAQDARMGEVYWASYARGNNGLAVAVVEDQLRAPDAVTVPEAELPWVAVGDAWPVYPEALEMRAARFGPLERLDVAPHAYALMRIGARRLAEGLDVAAEQLLPVYLRGQGAWKKKTP